MLTRRSHNEMKRCSRLRVEEYGDLTLMLNERMEKKPEKKVRKKSKWEKKESERDGLRRHVD